VRVAKIVPSLDIHNFTSVTGFVETMWKFDFSASGDKFLSLEQQGLAVH